MQLLIYNSCSMHCMLLIQTIQMDYSTWQCIQNVDGLYTGVS